MTCRVIPLPFDSEIFEMPCGRLELVENCFDYRIVSSVMYEAWANGMRHVTVRVPAEWQSVREILETLRFRFVLNSLSLDKAVHGRARCDSAVDVYDGSDDLRLRELTRRAFAADTRFHLEPAFATERVEHLHERWIQNLIDDDSVVVLAHRDGDTFTGYVTVQPGSKTGEGHIGLIAVDPRFRGRGVGRKLLRSCESEVTPSVERIGVMTESTNTRAIRLYTSNGYKVCRTWSVWHAVRGGSDEPVRSTEWSGSDVANA